MIKEVERVKTEVTGIFKKYVSQFPFTSSQFEFGVCSVESVKFLSKTENELGGEMQVKRQPV